MIAPKSWTTIAVYSLSENRFVPTPGAKITEAQAVGNPLIARRTTSVSGKKLLQIKAK